MAGVWMFADFFFCWSLVSIWKYHRKEHKVQPLKTQEIGVILSYGIMAVKRHFTGKPICQEYEPSDDSELESELEEDESERQQQQKSIKTNIQIRPVERDVIQKYEEKVGQPLEEPQAEQENQSESEEEESSDEEDSSEEDSSDDEPKMLKPVFLSKTKRAQVTKSSTPPKTKDQKAAEDRERTLKTIEAHINQDIEYRKQLKESTQNYGGIDDTDDLDPEAERAEWELRQLQREQRDRAKLEQEQDELEELENRRLRTEEEREKEFREKQATEEQNEDGSSKSKAKGAFFRDEELLKRDLGEENEKYDKNLLPQRFNPDKL